MVESGQRQRADRDRAAELISFDSRVVIENVQPELDAGKFPVKRVLGETVRVTAGVHTDGHNALRAVLQYRHASEPHWRTVEMEPLSAGLDLFRGEFTVDELGTYEYTLLAWIDDFSNWRRDTAKKIAAHQDVSVEIAEGRQLIEQAAQRAAEDGRAEELKHYVSMLRDGAALSTSSPVISDKRLDELMFEFADRGRVARYDRVLRVTVDPKYALFSSWYELFPRSATDTPGRHGTFKDVIELLPYVSELGFDVLYLPPIHPIGVTNRKGRNNTLTPESGDVGSPWAIGADAGGHKSVHPDLGTMDDFRALVEQAGARGIRIALDIAFQCSPDHPWVKEHPEWFYHRPNGTIKYAENPPKKYEDIYPLNFECDEWQKLWDELVDVVRFWVKHGIDVFRVDNPHTKPYPFWQYLIETIKAEHPQVIFLAEAFARPRIMQQLAKLGFSQSYTYFTWRTSKWDLMEYMTELTRTEMSEYFRANFFANTPDILPENLQYGGRPSFLIRATLAATLSATWGIYGPVYELCINQPVPGKEEYLNSEKYEVICWNLNDPVSIAPYIARLNRIRKENDALHNNRSLRFFEVNNDNLIAYGKVSDDGSDIVIVIVNLDPYNVQSGLVKLPLFELGVEEYFQVHDLITDRRFNWSGETNFVELTPDVPAFIFRVRKRVRREYDFDYFV